jgi:predicted transcriptional regulator
MARPKGFEVLKVIRPKKVVSVRIDADLDERILQLEERLKTAAPHCQFDRSAIVEDALQEALATATRELDEFVAAQASASITGRSAS